MSTLKTTIDVNGGDLRIECKGAMDAPSIVDLIAKVKTNLLGHPSVSRAIVVTTGVTECAEAAKKELVALQKALATRCKRSAWIDERARFRGIALWVMHLAGDQNGKAVSTLDQAKHWLQSTEARESAARFAS